MATPKKSAAKLASTKLSAANELRSSILTAIVKEVGRIDPLAAGTYTKPDGFQNGQYGKYEKQDQSRTVASRVSRPGR